MHLAFDSITDDAWLIKSSPLNVTSRVYTGHEKREKSMLYSISHNFQLVKRLIQVIILAIPVALLTGCFPSTYSIQSKPIEARSLPSTQIYFYPLHGQNKSQQERDRYECYLWAVKQSGFDPSQSYLAPHQRVEVKALPPPGTGTAIGAISGAMIGSIISPRRRTGVGLVFGSITGALLGAASDVARQQEADKIQQQYDVKNTHSYVRLEKQARDYRRAMSACLEGRGYSVQ